MFGWAGADPWFLLFVFVFVYLVALGIDYNIFLMTRVREEAGRLGARQGAWVELAAPAAGSRQRAWYGPTFAGRGNGPEIA